MFSKISIISDEFTTIEFTNIVVWIEIGINNIWVILYEMCSNPFVKCAKHQKFQIPVKIKLNSHKIWVTINFQFQWKNWKVVREHLLCIQLMWLHRKMGYLNIIWWIDVSNVLHSVPIRRYSDEKGCWSCYLWHHDDCNAQVLFWMGCWLPDRNRR